MTRAGEVLDPLGIPIVKGALAQAPRVVWAGDAYVVVWQTNRNDQKPGLIAARIGRDGAILTAPRRIAGDALSQLGRYVATNGSRVVVGYTLPVAGAFSEIRAAVLDQNLDLVADTLLAPADVNRYHISIAWNGGRFLAVWNRGSRIEGVRLDANGTLLDAQPRLLGEGNDPELASDGSRFLVVTRVPTTTPMGLIWTARTIDPDLDEGTSRVLPEGDLLEQPNLVWTGSKYVVIARRSPESNITATDVGRDGSTIRQTAITSVRMTGLEPSPVAATNGTDLLVTWLESTDFNRRHAIRARVFDAVTFAPRSAELRLTTSANEQEEPALAFDGTNHFVVWSEAAGIYGTRVSPDGVSLDGRGVDGTAGTELRIASSGRSPVDLAMSGTSTLLVWTSGAGGISGARIDRASHAASAPVPLSPPLQNVGRPAAAWNGTEYLVAWTELDVDDIIFDPVIPMPARIRGTRVSESLTVRDPGSLVLADTPETWDDAPSLASNGTDWLLAWESDALHARRILANGTPGAETIVAGLIARPRVAWDGSRYTVAFHRMDVPETPLYVVNVTTDMIATAPRLIAETGSVRAPFSIAATANGVALAYTKWSWAPEHGGVDRVMLNVLARKARAIR